MRAVWWLCCASWVYWLLAVLGVVVSCEMCGSKLASGAWLLCFSIIAVTLTTDIFYLFLLLWGSFCQLGDTLGAMEGHMGAQNQIFRDLG